MKNHLEILTEATRTIASPARHCKRAWVTDSGGCSLGHLVVAAAGGVYREHQSGKGARQYILARPELQKAIKYVAAEMRAPANQLVDLMGTFGHFDRLSVENHISIVMTVNDAPEIRHEVIVTYFRQALSKAKADAIPPITERDIFPQMPPKLTAVKPVSPEKAETPTLDFAEVDSLLNESAEKEELVAA